MYAYIRIIQLCKLAIYVCFFAAAKILLLHAGGYSQRLPHVSVIGKIFMALPFGNPMYRMLEMLLIMYIDFPAKMNPGVFVTASDIMFLFDTKGCFYMYVYTYVFNYWFSRLLWPKPYVSLYLCVCLCVSVCVCVCVCVYKIQLSVLVLISCLYLLLTLVLYGCQNGDL